MTAMTTMMMRHRGEKKREKKNNIKLCQKEVVVIRSDLPSSDKSTNIQAKLFSFYVKSRRQTFHHSRFFRIFRSHKMCKEKRIKWQKTLTYEETSTFFPFLFQSQKKKRDENKNYLFRDLWLSSRHWMVELRVTVSYKRPAGTREHQMALRIFLCERIVTNACRSIDSLTTSKAVKTTDLWPFVSNFTSHQLHRLAHQNCSSNSMNEKSDRIY